LLCASTYRQIDIEDPTPARRLNDGASNVGTDGGAHKIDDQNNGHVISPLSQGHQVGNNHVDDHVDTPATHALDGPAGNECSSIVRATCDSAPQCEERDDCERDISPAENVGKLPEEGLHDGAV